MNTPADKPDLPSFEVSFSIEPNRKWSDFDVAKYASQASDEREAWARADERRKALEEAIASCSAIAANANRYCRLTDEDAYNEGRKDGADESADAIRALIDRKEPT